jgi:hypothetical protein
MAANFATSPAEHALNQVLDMSDKDDIKLYNKAVEKLMSGNDLFDLSPENLKGFLDLLNNRTNNYGWNKEASGLLSIPEDIHDANNMIHDNLIKSYGVITLQRVRNMEEAIMPLPKCTTQDKKMLYKSLMNSLTQAAKNQIQMYSEEFYVREKPSGALLLRVIIRESHLDSYASTTVIQQELSRLDDYMTSVGSDIFKFNQHVQSLVAALAARDATTHDLLTNLFVAYKAASDKTFREYAAQIESDIEDEKYALTAQQLMVKMNTKYRALRVKKIWNTPSAEDKKIMALQAQIDSFSVKQKEQKCEPKAIKRGSEAKKKKHSTNLDWLTKSIKPSPTSKIMKHKEAPWHWCCAKTGGKCGGKWRKHKPTECKGTAQRDDNVSDEKQLKIAKALQATASTKSESNADMDIDENDVEDY